MSVFVHSNIRFHFGFLQYVIATPRFHHWHHGVEEESIDVNYAVHFPVIDRFFGTYHLPADRWPVGYGVSDNSVPRGYWKQFIYPFYRKRKNGSEGFSPSAEAVPDRASDTL